MLADLARELWAEVQRLQQVEQALREENKELRRELLQLYRQEIGE